MSDVGKQYIANIAAAINSLTHSLAFDFRRHPESVRAVVVQRTFIEQWIIRIYEDILNVCAVAEDGDAVPSLEDVLDSHFPDMSHRQNDVILMTLMRNEILTGMMQQAEAIMERTTDPGAVWEVRIDNSFLIMECVTTQEQLRINQYIRENERLKAEIAELKKQKTV